MPDNTTKIHIGTHKSLKYKDCIIDLFKNSTMASTACKTPHGPIKNTRDTHVETSRNLDDVYVEAVHYTYLNERIQVDQGVVGQVQSLQDNCAIKDLHMANIVGRE